MSRREQLASLSNHFHTHSFTHTSGATGIIKGDGVGTKFASAKSVRLSKLGIWHKTSGDIKSRPSEAMRLNWTL